MCSVGEILSLGGDDRLTLNENKINKYYASTYPRSNVVSRGCCTCSTVSQESFDSACIANRISDARSVVDENGREELYSSEFEVIRDRISAVLRLNEIEASSDVVLFPSGSDAELMTTSVALVKQFSVSAKTDCPILNLVVAAGEVGSGTANAASGLHFSDISPTNMTQKKDKCVDGLLPTDVELCLFKPRSVEGSSLQLQQYEDAIEAKLTEAITKNPNRVCLLHVVCGSKTGLVYPSLQFAKAMTARHPDNLLVVVDCCQLRCHYSYIHQCIGSGFMCLITGSKFFTGPPFCGAVLLPRHLTLSVESHISLCQQQPGLRCRVAKGLVNYLTPFEVPATMPLLRQLLRPATGAVYRNAGLYLRWASSLAIMEQFWQIPRATIDAFGRQWVADTRALVRACHPYLQLVDTPLPCDETLMCGGTNTIVSIALWPDAADGGVGEALGLEQCKLFHKELSCVGVCGTKIMIGQPVQLHTNTASSDPTCVVRLALGADMVIRGLDTSRAEAEVVDTKRVVLSMRELVKTWFTRDRPGGGSTITDVPHAVRMWDIDRALGFCGKDGVNDSDACPVGAGVPLDPFLWALEAIEATGSLPDVFMLYDMDVLGGACRAVNSTFAKTAPGGNEYLHCFAIKSCPLSYVVHHVVAQHGLGLETASIMEVKQALRCGCAPNKIMFDSPCKSISEIETALKLGVHLNANSINEMLKIAEVRQELCTNGALHQGSTVGLRINPLIGGGSIAALSTATATSKFGIPLTASTKPLILDLIRKYPYIQGLMCHVGSQGMPVELMANGVLVLCSLADEVDQLCLASEGRKRITLLDIGGGLSANYSDEKVSPTFDAYLEAILKVYPGFHTQGRTIVTEFGKSLVSKAGVVCARVEDIVEQPQDVPGFVDGPSRCTIVTHAGADLLLRTAYNPISFPHRFHLLSKSKEKAECLVTIAGPLCFSGDILATDYQFPVKPQMNDRVLALDAGANTISIFSRHCSRLAPAIYAFRRLPTGGTGEVTVVCIKEKEREQDLLHFWE